MGRGVCSTAHASLKLQLLVRTYIYVLYVRLKTAPLLPVTRPPKLCITGGHIRRSKKPIFLSKFARYIYVGVHVHVHKRGHRPKMIALPPLNLNIILQVSSYSSYCILIVSRQKQSILVVKNGNLFTNNHNSYLVLHKCILITIIITILAADILKSYQLPGFVQRVKSGAT